MDAVAEFIFQVQSKSAYELKIKLAGEFGNSVSNGTQILVLNICSKFPGWIFIEQIRVGP